MKLPRVSHPWVVSPRRAVAIQRRLAARVRREPDRKRFDLVAGLDAAFTTEGSECIAAAVVWSRRERRVVEERWAIRRLRFPYVPGLLSFREAPAVIAALRKLRHEPDALLYDGHGYAHPRRFGIACHVGVLADLATAGCAKSRLVGEHREPGKRRGSRTLLRHDGDIVGSVVRTRDGVRPVFVSIGHRMDLATAERLVLACNVGYRLPEPTRLADQLVGRLKRER